MEKDVCFTLVCMNGGTCVVGMGCQCVTPWNGLTCNNHTLIDHVDVITSGQTESSGSTQKTTVIIVTTAVCGTLLLVAVGLAVYRKSIQLTTSTDAPVATSPPSTAASAAVHAPPAGASVAGSPPSTVPPMATSPPSTEILVMDPSADDGIHSTSVSESEVDPLP